MTNYEFFNGGNPFGLTLDVFLTANNRHKTVVRGMLELHNLTMDDLMAHDIERKVDEMIEGEIDEMLEE